MEVKTKKANGYGLYDMCGNVSEWCWDRCRCINDEFGFIVSFEDISSDTPATGSASGSVRCERGGYFDAAPNRCTVDIRDVGSPSSRSSRRGFRVVRTAK